MKIISITGTKGKTSVTRILSQVLFEDGENTLHVDTDGYAINQKRQGTLEESKKLFNLVPTVCPGKYLLSMKDFYPNYAAVLECSIGSSGSAGLGYGYHHVGIFTNVLEDHLGASKRLKRKSDIAKYKSFIFKNLRNEGYAVFNADDKMVTKQLSKLPSDLTINLVPCGITFKAFNIRKHLRNGGMCLTVKGGCVILKDQAQETKLLELSSIPWTFGGNFLPAVYNILFVLGGVYGFHEGKISDSSIRSLKQYRFHETGGRMVFFENKEGTRIIADYAHEKYSLQLLGELCQKLKTSTSQRVIGVVRLAPDRTNKMIAETGKFIASSFDQFIVYDKIDGVTKKEYRAQRGNIRYRAAGEVSQIFYDGILSKNKNVERIIQEEAAIQQASKTAKPGDIVVIICGENASDTVKWIKSNFQAQIVE